MSVLFWQKGRLVKGFARTLADDLYSSLDAGAASSFFDVDQGMDAAQGNVRANPKKAQRKEEARFRDVKVRLEDAVLRLQQFKQGQRLGIYYRARLHQILLDRLIELGYSPELAKKINHFLLIQTP